MFKYFSLEEFECPCCKTNMTDFDLIDCLDEIRHSLGKPLKINSGYRCPQHNRDVGGVKSSFHLRGMAADVSTENLDSEELYRLITSLLDHGFSLGISKSFIHMDGRADSKKIWTY